MTLDFLLDLITKLAHVKVCSLECGICTTYCMRDDFRWLMGYSLMLLTR